MRKYSDFLTLLKFKEKVKVLLKKSFRMGKKCHTEYASVKDPQSMYRPTSNETTLIPEISNIINEKNLIVASRQGKTSFNFK